MFIGNTSIVTDLVDYLEGELDSFLGTILIPMGDYNAMSKAF